MLCLSCFLYSDLPTYSCTDSQGRPFDHKLINRFKNKENGIFIEAGAHDGITQSNTKLLEDYFGWTGLLIEPSPILYPTLKKNRQHSKCYDCALGKFEENNTYVSGDFDGSLMSSIHGFRLKNRGTVKVLIRSLQSILDEEKISHVDFFSLDVEGYEYYVLQGIDFGKTTFDYLLIEIYRQQSNRIINLLSENGYSLIECFSNFNRETCPDWDGTHNDYLFISNQIKWGE